jgi:hypothetical protein
LIGAHGRWIKKKDVKRAEIKNKKKKYTTQRSRQKIIIIKAAAAKKQLHLDNLSILEFHEKKAATTTTAA